MIAVVAHLLDGEAITEIGITRPWVMSDQHPNADFRSSTGEGLGNNVTDAAIAEAVVGGRMVNSDGLDVRLKADYCRDISSERIGVVVIGLEMAAEDGRQSVFIRNARGRRVAE